MARRRKADEVAARVRNLFALDATGIMRRLEARRDEMFVLFSRLRSREPLLSAIASRYGVAAVQGLLHLTVQEQAVVDRFYERLDDLRWYFTYTEDMPGTASQTFSTLYRRLEEAHRALLLTLGPPAPPDGVTVVDAKATRYEAPLSQETALDRPAPARRRA
jgi:hypothetical protein